MQQRKTHLEQVESHLDLVDNPLVAHLESEVEYLRDQLDKQTRQLAAPTKHNADLPLRVARRRDAIQQLPPPLWEGVPTPDFSRLTHG